MAEGEGREGAPTDVGVGKDPTKALSEGRCRGTYSGEEEVDDNETP